MVESLHDDDTEENADDEEKSKERGCRGWGEDVEDRLRCHSCVAWHGSKDRKIEGWKTRFADQHLVERLGNQRSVEEDDKHK